ncbi:N-acetyl-gamma-glutamyl-phosphate reductase [Pseudomonas syringae pv. syringae]|nr:N-acetyl-gamma-glutamyl-phosphate reductase [Pseudomonas syringae pv. syringae]
MIDRFPVVSLRANLRGHYDGLAFSVPDVKTLGACDVVFFATPHGVAHALAGELLAAGTKVIDLSADFRLQDPVEWAKWYGQPHGAPQLLEDAVYGLPEVNREQIRNARLIAVPGCYPTATQLGFLPLLEAGIVDNTRLIADCKSGVSGAGDIGLTFVPHLVPMIRGIHSTLYATVADRSVDLQALFEKRYADEPFVDVMPAGSHPETRSVRGANVCRIAVHRPQGGDLVVVLSVIDNLVKGASGQAVQNMNILFGLDERAGLSHAGMMP